MKLWRRCLLTVGHISLIVGGASMILLDNYKSLDVSCAMHL